MENTKDIVVTKSFPSFKIIKVGEGANERKFYKLNNTDLISWNDLNALMLESAVGVEAVLGTRTYKKRGRPGKATLVHQEPINA